MAEAFQAAGNVISGIGGYEAGRFNKRMSDTEAVEIERAGAIEEGRVRDAARMAIGEQVAAQGANGFAQGTGSALDALTKSQVNATLDAMNVRQQAAQRARAARVSGRIALAQGNNALVAGMIGAGGNAVDWASKRKNG